jgi:hypothetical protein
MGGSGLKTVATALADGRNIDAADVIALLGEVYAKGIGARAEAEALISFDRSLAETTPQWRDYFAAAIADHVVLRHEPAGLVDQEKADWLTAALAPAGQTASASGIEALVRTLETAREAPATFAAFALSQLRASAPSGRGPVVGGRAHFSRAIGAGTVALIQRVLVAAGGEAGRPVSRAEAEALFDLHDMSAGSPNDPAFDDLFFDAIANHLLAASGHRVAPRPKALASDPRAGERRSAFRMFGEAGEAGRVLAAGAGKARLESEHVAWLSSRIMRDGRPTAAEHALLALFTQETRDSDPSLRRFAYSAA